jgi:hypothetical protein
VTALGDPHDLIQSRGSHAARTHRLIQSCGIRGYEWVIYAWSAGVGALWGGLVNPFVSGVEPSNPLQWLALWPGWLDLQLRSLVGSTAFWNPIVEPSFIGMVGACVVAYMLLTISHIRE